jgi:hypothetical protein
MEMKILAAALAIALVAFVGVGFAMPGWAGFAGWGMMNGPAQNGSWQWGNASLNGTMHGGGNGTFGMRGRGMGLNQTFNSTQVQEFDSAVASGDYATAKQLHDDYGIGGSLFGKLNETTFPQYSQIYNLQSQLTNLTGQLRQELGFGGKQPMGPHFGGFMMGHGGFGRGMRHR